MALPHSCQQGKGRCFFDDDDDGSFPVIIFPKRFGFDFKSCKSHQFKKISEIAMCSHH